MCTFSGSKYVERNDRLIVVFVIYAKLQSLLTNPARSSMILRPGLPFTPEVNTLAQTADRNRSTYRYWYSPPIFGMFRHGTIASLPLATTPQSPFSLLPDATTGFTTYAASVEVPFRVFEGPVEQPSDTHSPDIGFPV
ncbi:hypothetical protein Moror_8172 [Moniliophthora roreri MCA 2997]|uniref:Uncharacterized protein n=1 Tax=Moniliophthora roreri (strain MCA 2997) TaxID=1381753 RepID=V2XKU4_MONRO|nr:hypothetical protein Moror_8172 [Moniliophthora roreri MCA 2997]